MRKIWTGVAMALVLLLCAGITGAQNQATRLTWEMPVVASLTGYKVYHNEVAPPTDGADMGAWITTTGQTIVGPTTTALALADIVGLKPGTVYYFTVTAFNDDVESGYSNVVSGYPTMPVPFVRIE